MARPRNEDRGLPPARSNAARSRPAHQVTLPRELWAAIDARAQAEGVKRSALIESMMRTQLAQPIDS
jgi:hypothetical protein